MVLVDHKEHLDHVVNKETSDSWELQEPQVFQD